ncbi:MAG: DUF368 domain-containing protein [Proteobacteria bacterium]|nr:DUF368 domain-containing protein [Pseudomonadota bacterium]
MIKSMMIVAKGAAMGAADVVPGVSGGTIALLTGIYPRLINAIASVDVAALKFLLSGNIKSFWKKIDGNFILLLLVGIVSAFALLAHSIKQALEFYPILTWSFFFGLIIASSILIIKQIPHKKILGWLWLIPGIAFGVWISSQGAIAFPNSQLAIFIAGMIAICAMILPGISGSFILILLGMYEILITAVTEREITTILIFMLGAVIGLLVFSRIIKLVLSKYYQTTLFFLSGLMLGSLLKIWPWKITNQLIVQTPKHVETIVNVMPASHPTPQTILAISMMIAAIFLVFVIDFFGNKLSSVPQS